MNKTEIFNEQDTEKFEKIKYKLIDREEFINDLIGWISEASRPGDNRNGDPMREDLKYLISLPDKIIFSNLSTNEYIAESENEEYFNILIKEYNKL